MTPDEILGWRLSRQLTQRQLAVALGYSDTESSERLVRRWERGEVLPPPMLRLALERLAA